MTVDFLPGLDPDDDKFAAALLGREIATIFGDTEFSDPKKIDDPSSVLVKAQDELVSPEVVAIEQSAKRTGLSISRAGGFGFARTRSA